jgi:hypothetical protein
VKYSEIHLFGPFITWILPVILEELMVTVPSTRRTLMVLSISGVVLLAIIVFLFFRKDGLKASHAVVCSLFGFFVAGTAIAPSIKAGSASLASLLGGIKF